MAVRQAWVRAWIGVCTVAASMLCAGAVVHSPGAAQDVAARALGATTVGDTTLVLPVQQRGYFFLVDLDIGSIPARVSVVIDSASANLMVLSSSYDPSKSSSASVHSPIQKQTLGVDGEEIQFESIQVRAVSQSAGQWVFMNLAHKGCVRVWGYQA